MKPDEVASNKNRRRSLAISLGLLLFSIYLFIYRGGFHSIDEVSIFAVTESLVKFGRFNTDQIAWTQWTTSQAEAQGFFGADGHVFSKKGLALSLAQVPLYWLGLNLPGLGMLQTVSLLNAFITAATGLLIFMFLWRMNFSPATAVITTLIFGIATIASVYAKYLFSEPLAGFLLLLAAYMLFVYRQEGGLRHVVIAGLAAGFAVLTRANNLFLLPIFGLYLLYSLFIMHRMKRPFIAATIRSAAVFLLALAIPGAILLAYNGIRSGHPLQTGYDLTLFSPNVLVGLYKLLFSPLRGLFVYSPILLLSLPSWWRLRQIYPAEAWLFAGLVGVTLGLFSAWSSGEGLSWGSRFLVPVVPFFVICLAPVVEQITGGRHHVLRFAFYVLLPLSFFIQILGVAINPWGFLARLQADFGGEFFLENTAALYNFRYSQIIGQLQSWSLDSSDLAWWQPWGFDGLAFGLSLFLVLATLVLFYCQFKPQSQAGPTRLGRLTEKAGGLLFPIAVAVLALLVSNVLLIRYYQADRQFGPPDDAYIQALNTVTTQALPDESIITVAQNHYHVPMNRFKARIPLIGFAQQAWPLPETAPPLLSTTTSNQNIWLVTIGFPPAAPNNATEQWLALNTFKASDVWFPADVRLVRFSPIQPTVTRPIGTVLGEEVQLVKINLIEATPAGHPLPVEFIWQPVTQPEANYNLFLQLLDINGTMVAQHDSPPIGGYGPTSGWLAGQQIASRHALILPSNLNLGEYRLIAGLVNPTSGQRLSTDTGSDFVELGNLTIIEEVRTKQQTPETDQP